MPNPFGPETSLHFSLPRDGRVDLRIYDVAGRLVRKLASGSRPAGENARRLAAVAAAAVLCGELSLLAALTNPGELMDAHLRMERE